MFRQLGIDVTKLTMGVSSASEILEGIERGVKKFSFSLKDRNKPSHKEKLIELSLILQSNAPIYSLGLYVEDIQPEEVQILAGGLAHNSSLKILNLRGNKIDSQGAKYLNEALKTNTGLEELELTENCIGGHIDSCLLENKTLKRLDLFDCGINNRQAAKLLDALKHNSTLKELDLCKNGLTSHSISVGPSYEFEDGELNCYPDGAVDIVKILIDFIKTNSGLRKIRLVFNNFDKYEMQDIARAIEHNYSLTSADLTSLMITQNIYLPFLKRNQEAYEARLAYEAPYTNGAVAGMFQNKIIEDVCLTHIGTLLDRQTGGRVAQVNRAAAQRAQQEMDKKNSKRSTASTDINDDTMESDISSPSIGI